MRSLLAGRTLAVLLLMGGLLAGLLLAATPVAAQPTPEEALLRASNAGAEDQFGCSVAIDGDRAVVGACLEDGGAQDAGAAYVFERGVDGTWTETQVLRASDTGGVDLFGYSVAIDGDRLVVGTPFEDGPADGVQNAGAAYVFERSAGGTWTETQVLRASNADTDDEFGESVAIDGDRVVVGAFTEDGPSDGAQDAGAAYVFEHGTDGTWTETQVLRASNTGEFDLFGESVAISGDRVVVGARGEDGPADAVSSSGAAYVFERSAGETWAEVALLRASFGGAGADDRFGSSVAIDGDRAVVGTYLEDGMAPDAGAAYVFERSADGTWAEAALLRASNAGAEDFFGESVAIRGNRAVVGARGEDRPLSNGAQDTGAAYVFERGTDGTWAETQLLRASNAESFDRFGESVAISGDRVVGGAFFEDGPSNELDGAGAVYVFSVIPEADLFAETSPSRTAIADDGAFDVGAVSVGLSRTDTFTIENNGGATLTVSSVTSSNTSDFTISSGSSGGTVAGGGATTFDVTFSPTLRRTRTSTITIRSNDPDEDPYTFAIQGYGLAPEIAIRDGGGTLLRDGSGSFEYGTVDVGTASQQGFRIENTGREPLTLDGQPAVQIGGSHPGDFSVTAAPSSPVASGGGRTSFAITFNPQARETRTATVTVPNNDPDENPYTFEVTGTGTIPPLYVDAGATGVVDGSSWTDAFVHLQDALGAATGSDQIWIAAGTYYPDVGAGVTGDDRDTSFRITGDQDGLQIYGGFAGTETALTERDLTAGHETILSGDIDQNGASSGNSYHVLVFDGGTQGPDVAANVTPATVLDGVTVTGGQADGSYLNDGNKGGGLYCDGVGPSNECSPKIRNAVFTGNAAGGPNSGSGGAMYNMGGSGGRSSPVITNVTFIGNVSDGGGAIYNDGFSGVSSPVITNATFTGNVARDRFSGIGGAIYNMGASGVSNPQITNATFIGNVAYDAGAIYSNDLSGGTSRPQITNTMLWGNTARFGDIDEIGSTGAAPQYRHSLVQDVDLTSQGLGNLDGTTSSSDPLFADTGNLSGPDGVVGTADDGLRLSPGSPALDGGTNAPFEAGGVAESITTDRAGAARVQEGTVDLGAYEGAAGRTSATEPVASDGQVDFPGTGVTVAFTGVSGSGTVTVQTNAASPTDPGGLDPAFLTEYRLAITVTGDLTFGSSTEIRVDLSGFGDVPDPNEAVIYRRATVGSGPFSALPTTYDAGANQLVATTGTFSEFVVYNEPAPIPVELAGFTVAFTEAAGRAAVILRWETLSETNNAGFEVQRVSGSAGEQTALETTWQTIARLGGAGTTDQPQSYRFEDAALPYAADSLRYRLRQIDTDGTASVSDAVTIARTIMQAELLPTYPNPARGMATVRFAVPERQAVRIDLYDLLGRRVRTVVDTNAEGRTEQTLDVSRLASGTYFLRMQTSSHTETQRITVVR